MSTVAFDYDSVSTADEPLQYRALHTGAILGLVLGILSLAMWAAAANSIQSCFLVAPIPLLGMAISMWSLGRIRRDPDVYTGRQLAICGLALSLVFLVTGVSYAGYVYATEVPEGYARISFAQMKPDEIQELGGVAIPPQIAALDGKEVFIKGYIRPDSITVSKGIKRFLLVRDNNQCCFGDISSIKYYDQIDVDMVGARRVDYSQGVFRIGGILHINPQNLAMGGTKPVFSLEADYAK